MTKFITIMLAAAAVSAPAISPAAAHDVHLHIYGPPTYYYAPPLPNYPVPAPSYSVSYRDRTIHYVYPSGAVYSTIVVDERRPLRGMRKVRRR